METALIACFALVAGAVLAYFVAPKRNISSKELGKARQENAALSATLIELEKRVQELRGELQENQKELNSLREKNATLAAERKAQEEKLSERESLFQQMQLQFENMAAKIMEQSSVKLAEQSKHGMDEVLKPFKDRFLEFQNTVKESFGQHAKEQHLLKDHLQRMVEANQTMQAQTENLTKALKGDVKAQGNWGEIMLERILQDAGLRPGYEYIVQGAQMGLKHVEDGSQLKPDVIVKLPDGKHIIIDAKVSLTHYERFCSALEEVEKAAMLKLYLNSVRAHVTGLSQRRYQDAGSLGTPDFVLMFMPIEGAFSLAIQADTELHAYAWDKQVVMVCPSTLYASIRTIACLWKVETQNRYAMDIAKRGGELYDKVASFVGEMQAIRKHIDNAGSAHEKALGLLSTGKGNVLRQVEMLKDLGAKASKSLPRELIDDEETAEILPLVS